MKKPDLLLIAADTILVVHALFVAFVIIGLLLIIVGGIRDWSWTRSALFRIAHLLAIGIVVLQSWLGIICPLTTWEMNLRRAAGQQAYDGTFISHWVGELLYYQAPPWVFITLYTLFCTLVIFAWIRFPPRRKPRRTD